MLLPIPSTRKALGNCAGGPWGKTCEMARCSLGTQGKGGSAAPDFGMVIEPCWGSLEEKAASLQVARWRLLVWGLPVLAGLGHMQMRLDQQPALFRDLCWVEQDHLWKSESSHFTE